MERRLAGVTFHIRRGGFDSYAATVSLVGAALVAALVATGETRAENAIAWGRNALKERGLLSRASPRGVWELASRRTPPLPAAKRSPG